MDSLEWIELIEWNPPSQADNGYINHRLNFSLLRGASEIQSRANILLTLNASKHGTAEYNFKVFLFECVCYSRIDERMIIAAANAMTILNYARISLSGMNFSNVKIPGADLTGCICDNSNFTGADLSNVNFTGASLQGTVFTKSTLTNVNFGEYPSVSLKDDIVRICYINSGVVAVTQECEIQLYTQDLTSLVDPLEECAKGVRGMAFCPTRGILAYGGLDKTLCLWDLKNKSMFHRFEDNSAAIRSVAFNHTGTMVTSGGDDMTIRVWNVQDKCLVFSVEGVSFHLVTDLSQIDVQKLSVCDNKIVLIRNEILYNYSAYCVKEGQFIQDGRQLPKVTPNIQLSSAVVAFDGTINVPSSGYDQIEKIIDAIKLNLGYAPFVGHIQPISTLEFSPTNPELLLSGSLDRSIRLWNVSQKSLIRIFNEHKGTIRAIAFSNAGQYFVSGSEDYDIFLWNINRDKKVDIIGSHTNWVSSLAFTQDHQQIISGGFDNVIRLWDLNRRVLLKTFGGHVDQVNTVAVIPDGQGMFLSGSADKTLRQWNLSHSNYPTDVRSHRGAVRSLTLKIAPQGTIRLASGGDDRDIRLWNVEIQASVRNKNAHEGRITAISFNPDTTLLASASWDRSAHLWDPLTGKVRSLRRDPNPDKNWITSLSFNRDGTKLALGSEDCTVCVWDVTDDTLFHCFETHTGGVIAVCFSPTHNLLLSGSHDKTACLWDVDNKKLLHPFEDHKSWVNCVAFDPTGEKLVTAEDDGDILVWGRQNKDLLFKFNHMSVISIGFSPDGRILASSNYHDPRDPSKGRICLWDAIDPKCLLVISGFSEYIQTLSFISKDEELFLATGGDNGSVRYWQIYTQNLLPRARLIWSSIQDSLVVTEARFDQLKDISRRNLLLLQQKNALLS
jgi:WD40 repeat protein